MEQDNNYCKSEEMIENVSGCGLFQFLISVFVFLLGNASTAFTVFFMSFGVYNPGWQCVNKTEIYAPQTDDNDKNYNLSRPSLEDTNSYHSNHSYQVWETTNINFDTNECSRIDLCDHIIFHSDSSTIVTEWVLICDKNWLPSLITSIQMAGMFFGSLVAGYIGDAFGRKRSVYLAASFLALFNFLSILSPNWKTYAIMRFVLGFFSGITSSLFYVLSAEFLPKRSRALLQGLPFWIGACTLGMLTYSWLRNWRHVHIATGILGVVGLIPAVYFPESLRWLETKNYSKEFYKAVEKLLRCNGKQINSVVWNSLEFNSFSENTSVVSTRYNIFHLFSKEYRIYTTCLCFQSFIITLLSYSVTLGVIVLKGDFYLNLVLMFAFQIPFSIFPAVLPNAIGRKMSCCLFAVISGICFIIAFLFEELSSSESIKRYGISIPMFISAITVDSYWVTQNTMSLEIYPTVIRSLGLSCSNALGRLGSVFAPFVFQSKPSLDFVSYIIMAVLSFSCIPFLLKLPETKGITLKERLYERIQGDNRKLVEDEETVKKRSK